MFTLIFSKFAKNERNGIVHAASSRGGMDILTVIANNISVFLEEEVKLQK